MAGTKKRTNRMDYASRFVSYASLTKPAVFLTLNFFNKFFLCVSTVDVPMNNWAAISFVVYSFIINFNISFSLLEILGVACSASGS